LASGFKVIYIPLYRVSRRKMLLYMGVMNAACIVAYAIFDRLSIFNPVLRYGCVVGIILFKIFLNYNKFF
jgi:hypothetical protein